jgi:hypothetical protein
MIYPGDDPLYETMWYYIALGFEHYNLPAVLKMQMRSSQSIFPGY